MVEAVILAAGKSERADGFKLGFDINGKTVIERSIEGLYNICSRIIVVTGYNADCIKKILEGYNKVQFFFNDNFEKGMLTSIKTGIREVRTDTFFLQPGDMPLIPESVYKSLMNHKHPIIVPSYKTRKGHPLYIISTMIEKILEIPDNATLKDFIEKNGYSAIEVHEKGVLYDLDTREDFNRIVNFKTMQDE